MIWGRGGGDAGGPGRPPNGSTRGTARRHGVPSLRYWVYAIVWLACALVSSAASPAQPSDFKFDRDTLAFANSTVFEYHQGVARLRPVSGIAKERTPRYTRRCFVMCRTVVQFTKFARFEPRGRPLTDTELAQRIRAVTRHGVYQPALPLEKRVVFPGYRNLRELSHDRGWVMQKNIGLGWPTYLRIGNYRMVYNHSKSYQWKQHEEMNRALNRGELFVAFLSDFPILHINHAVMVYQKKPSPPNETTERYNTYDPNHPDGPRELIWYPDKREFSFEKDEEFVGGFARVFHVYGRPLQ